MPHRLAAAALLAWILATAPGCRIVYDRMGGPYRGTPQEAFGKPGLSQEACDKPGLSPEARELVNRAFRGLEHRTMVDHHVHFFGNGTPARYEYAPELQAARDADPPRTNFREIIEHQKAWQRPFVQGVYLDTLEVTDTNRMDDQYLARLVDLVRWYGPPDQAANPGAATYRTDFLLYALDGAYRADGTPDPASFNYVSNEYVIALADALNRKIRGTNGFTRNRFVPVGSVNPLRAGPDGGPPVMRATADWMRELDRLSTHGVRYLKWRPPSMKLDPAAVSDDFYRELATRRIAILSHTGESMGLGLPDTLDAYAGPRRLRRAVELGVEVVMLHLGRMGTNAATGRSYADEFFDEVEYHRAHGRRLHGELSAVPYGDSARLLPRLVSGECCPPGRLVNGSDYPAVTPWFVVGKSLKNLVDRDYLTSDQRRRLREIFRYNPLLFDFVLKRTLCIDGRPLPEACFLGLPEDPIPSPSTAPSIAPATPPPTAP